MRQTYRSAGTVLLRCASLILLGLWMVLWPHQVETVVQKGTLVALSLLSLVDLIEWLAYQPKRSRDGMFKLISALIYIGLLVLVWSLPILYLSFFSWILGIWVLFNAVLRTVSFVLYQVNKAEGRLTMLALALLSYGFGFWMICWPQANIRTVVYVMGCYLLAFGLTHLGDLFRILGITKQKGTRRGFRMSLPISLAALIPYGMIRRVNDLIDDETVVEKKSRRRVQRVPFDARKEDAPPDLEIFIHVTETGFSRFGHLDICFDGTMLSYGCYDERTRRFFRMFGEGHMIITEQKEKYIAFCCQENKKTIYGFGLRLTEEQKANVSKEFALLAPLLTPYHPDTQLSEMGQLPQKTYNDYASRMYRVTGARFYKFLRGKFKVYFSLGTNCVLLADTLIGAAGSDIISLTGVVTPGTYYDYLNRQFLIKNSNVISRKAYTVANQQTVINGFLERLK